MIIVNRAATDSDQLQAAQTRGEPASDGLATLSGCEIQALGAKKTP